MSRGSLFCQFMLTTLLALSWPFSTMAFTKRTLDFSQLAPEVRIELVKRFPFVESDELTLEQLDDIVRFLQNKPQYEKIQIFSEDNASQLRLEFVRTKIISHVKISGLREFSRSEAENIFAVKTGAVFDPQNIAEAGEKLRLAYRERGYLNAVIDIEMLTAGQEQVELHVKVTENLNTQISSINIQGANNELNKKLVKELRSYLNDPLTEGTLSSLQKSARDYLRKNRHVRAELIGPTLEYSKNESEVSLSFRLEKTDQYRLEYEGVRFLGIRDIEDYLDLENFYSANPVIGPELAQKIRNYYLAKGFARVEIKVEEPETRISFQKKIVFKVIEGPQIKIQRISVAGTLSKKESYYIEFIEQHSSKLISNGYYNKEDFEGGLKNLILELQNNGYLQSKIVSTRTQYNKEKSQISIQVNLDEGPLTEIQSIQFSGNNEYPNEFLASVLQLKAGPLRLPIVEAAITRLKDFYKENGYIEMLLLNEKEDLVTYDDTNTKASLHFKIFEGPQVKVASIIIDGNDFTKESVILNEIEFSIGKILTPNKIDESIARLQRTGFFRSVEIRTLEEKTNVANRTVLIKLAERDPGIFTLGAGATNERTLTLRGYTGIAYRNLLGTGRGVSLRIEGNYNVADIKYFERKFILGYLEPYLFNTRVRGRVNISRSVTVTDYDIRQVSEVNSTTYSIEKDFSPHILGVWDLWSLATIRDFGVDERYTFPTTVQEIATTGPTLDLDFRDNPFNPTQGTFTRWSAEYSSPALGSTETETSSIEYWKSNLNFTHYWNVGTALKQPVVWANQVRGGYLKNLSNKTNGGVPWDKKGFTLGGQSTIRGFETGTQEVFPNRVDLGLSLSEKTYTLMTDARMYLIKSELRFPIFDGLGGAVFYDGGSVEITGLNFGDKYRDSAGFGVRYSTPVGPLSLDLAWKLDAQPGESPWRFHLSIGTF